MRNKSARMPIDAADVRPYLDRVGSGTVVAFHTAWPIHYRTPAFFAHPYLGVDACPDLLERGVRTFA